MTKGQIILNYEAEIARLNLQIENLQMVCRRLSAAKSLESRDKIAKQCASLMGGSILREGGERG